MTTTPENSQPSKSKSPATYENSAITSAGPDFQNPFQELGADESWRRLRVQCGNVVTREEMVRRVQEQARKK